MTRSAFDGFSAIVPEGWKAGRDEVTYSEAGEHAPMRFRSPGRRGILRVSVPWLDPDEQPGRDPDELDALAREWGLRRGVDTPMACTTEIHDGVARAAASYKLGEDFVEVWFVSDGETLIRASYVCRWDDRDIDRAAREALAGSLRPT